MYKCIVNVPNNCAIGGSLPQKSDTIPIHIGAH